MTVLSALVGAVCLVGLSRAQGPPLPANKDLPGTSFLDHTGPISGFFDKTFLNNNIPYLETPDRNITDVFYYRLSILPRHLHYAIQGTGYTTSEFITPAGYGSAFGLITAAAGHQIEETQWLRGSFYTEDNIQAYTRGPAATDPTSADDIVFFSHWIQFAALGASNVTGNSAFIINQLDGMIQMWDLWRQFFDTKVGLYAYTSDFDAQENSLAGYVANAATGGANPGNVQREGPLEFRPSVNAYMIANADAIARVAAAASNPTQASNFTTIANNLRAAFIKTMWNDTQKFFVGNIQAGQPAAGQLNGREEIGMFPFRFGVGLDSKYMNGTVSALFDTKAFKTPYYPTTLEIGNKYYTASKPCCECCYWQGQNWPYSTAHTVQSLAAMVRAGAATADQYLDLLHNYAITQYKDGVPYVAESHYPDQNAWSQDDQSDHHSQHYLHSTYINNVITGIIGINPRLDNILELNPIIPSNWTYFALENVPYHGLLLTILYDKDNMKYKQGAGLTVFANGKNIYNGQPQAKVTLPTGLTPSNKPIQQNVAVNTRGDAAGTYPQISATYSFNGDSPYNAIDGVIYFDEVPANRWTNYNGNGARANDTLSLTLQRPRNITGVALAIFDDTITKSGGGVGCPARILITDGTGKTLADATNFKSTCLSNDINIIKFSGTVLTNKLNLNFFGQPNLAVGVAELQLWTDAITGPVYFAADAFPSSSDFKTAPQHSSQVQFDPQSQAAGGGNAVVAMIDSHSMIGFSGIYSSTRRTVTPFITYKNNGTATVSLNVNVNRFNVGTLTLPKTTSAKGYDNRVNLPSITLLPGSNFLTLTGGASGLYLEDITIN